MVFFPPFRDFFVRGRSPFRATPDFEGIHSFNLSCSHGDLFRERALLTRKNVSPSKSQGF